MFSGTLPILDLREVHLVVLALWGGVVLCESVIELIPYKFPDSRAYSADAIGDRHL